MIPLVLAYCLGIMSVLGHANPGIVLGVRSTMEALDHVIESESRAV